MRMKVGNSNRTDNLAHKGRDMWENVMSQLDSRVVFDY